MKPIICKAFLIGISAIISNNTNAQSEKYYSLTVDNFRDFAPFNETIDVNNPDIKRINAAIFYVTNETRVKRKLSYLDYNKKLEIMATNYSAEMAKYNFFSHTHPKSRKLKTPKDRALASGIENPYIAENIIEGYLLQYKNNTEVIADTPGEFRDVKTKTKLLPHTYLSLADDLVDRWMHSKGHKANILSKDALQLGCGVAVYTDKKFNFMPCLKATQNFQLYEEIKK